MIISQIYVWTERSKERRSRLKSCFRILLAISLAQPCTCAPHMKNTLNRSLKQLSLFNFLSPGRLHFKPADNTQQSSWDLFQWKNASEREACLSSAGRRRQRAAVALGQEVRRHRALHVNLKKLEKERTHWRTSPDVWFTLATDKSINRASGGKGKWQISLVEANSKHFNWMLTGSGGVACYTSTEKTHVWAERHTTDEKGDCI